MSLTTKVNAIKIKDKAAVVTAVQALKAKGVNCQLKENVAPRMYYERQYAKKYGKETCDLVVALPGPYDMGLHKESDGSYAPVFDNHCNHIGQYIGAKGTPTTPEERELAPIGMFMQEYALAAAQNAAAASGHSYLGTTVDANGEIHLTVALN